MAVLAMFPLGSPLLPGGVLPLHVFETRYVAMVRELLADDVDPPEFGVVMIERGREVGGGDQRSMVGTIARIAEIRALPDDRYALVAIGSERLRVNAWLPDDPYPLADIDRWPDDDLGLIDLDDARRQIAALHLRLRALNDEVRALGTMTPPPDTEISDDPHLAAYHLGSLAPLADADRQRLLQSGSLAARLAALEQALDDAAAVVRFRST